MPAPIRIILSELRVAQTVSQRTRDRAHMIRLNARGWNVPAIAEIYQCHEHTVRATLRRWQAGGLSGLWEAPGRGAKASWSEADKQLVETWIESAPQTYNSTQLARKLQQQRQIKLSPDWIRRVMKKRASAGNAPVTVSETNRTCSTSNLSKQT
ncbi:MAG: helix-turn-helix domain-containing protein [Oculatellaceae cyanobacterium bins.114]|nr:helix-turn-helix domain-containing protein [Oculatellaceae cyanobacterium bins.114]